MYLELLPVNSLQRVAIGRSREFEPQQPCKECGRLTRTIGGRCPHCGAVKDSSHLPATSLEPRLDPWGSGWLTTVLFGVSGVLILIAGLVIAPEILFGLVLLAVIYALVSQLFEL